MDFKKTMDGIAQGNELVRLLLYILLFPLLAPYLLVEWIIESIRVKKEKKEKKEFKITKNTLARVLLPLVFLVVNGWLIIFLLPTRAESYVNEQYSSMTEYIFTLSDNYDLLNSGLILIGKNDLASRITLDWFYKVNFYLFGIITFLMYSRLTKYYKVLKKANLIKPNWLDNILLGRLADK